MMTSKFTRTISSFMTPALALCLSAGMATAQNQPGERDRDQQQRQNHDQQRRGDPMQNHPLWQVPSGGDDDWQSEDQWTPRQGDRQQMGQRDQMRQQAGDSYRTAYWEGYYDGYEDDDFGYDHWNDQWNQSYSSAYTDGYYDGYYDQQSQYGYDPNYYIYSVAIVPTAEEGQQKADRQRAEQRRQGDRTRARGDRRGDDASGQMQSGQRDMQTIAALSLVRGNVSSISQAQRSDKPDHTVLRIDFQDREQVTADFGPHMTRQRLPFQSGDRVSLIGYHKKADQGETIVVSQIAHEGKVYKLRGQKDAQRSGQTDQQRNLGRERNRDNQDREDRNRGGG